LKELGLSVGDRVKFKMSLDNVKRTPPSATIGPSGNREQESPPNSILEISPQKYPQSRAAPIPQHKRAPSEQNLSTSSSSASSLSTSASSLSSTPKRPALSSSTTSLRSPQSPQTPQDKLKSNSTNSIRRSAIPNSPPVTNSPPAELNMNTEEYQCKIVIIGPPATGKTSLVRRFAYGTFERGYKQTIGVDFEVKTVKWSENVLMHVQLWDIAGQERFSAVVPQFYRNAAAALVVFDVSDDVTLQLALKWNEHLQKHEIQNNGNKIPVMLIGNKADLLPADKTAPDLETVCKENNIAKWALTSAKTNQGIDEAINFLIERILTDNGVNGQDDQKSDTKIDLSKPTKKKEDSSCCI